MSPEAPISEAANASADLAATPDQVPSAPEGLGLVAASGKVVLLWHGGAAGQTGFMVQRQQDSDQGKFEEIVRLALPPGAGVKRVTWTDAQVKTGKTYAYRVAAYNAAGLSPFCPPLTVKVD